MSPVDTRAVPISETDTSLCAYLNRPNSFKYSPISAYALLQMEQSNNIITRNQTALDYSLGLYKQWEHC